ncbi:hypothetical protein ABT236_21065 [Streptomyces sp. NPDC001523]|uniref:hypothetical protein n=1 Tax=Streptomyces sp. NPDC001523 TaxID=3154383 RepID=UPI003323C804
MRSRALAALTVLAAAGTLSAVASPALAATGDGDVHNVYIIGSTNVQYAQDDNFNAGRDNTVGSNDGTAPPAAAGAASAMSLLDASNWADTF